MKEVLHLLFPKRCPICDSVFYFKKGKYGICPVCRDKLTVVQEPVCKICGKPVEGERREMCGDCQKRRHAFVQGKALWIYKGAVKKSIHRLKYSNRREYAIAYGQEMESRYGDWIRRHSFEAIIPIPLHKKRKRQRGYNQAELIGREISRLTGIPLRKDILMRCVSTVPQKDLNDEERKKNLKNAFIIAKNNVGLEKVLLVDDIYTTGSTMDSAAEALKGAGISEVYCISTGIGRGN